MTTKDEPRIIKIEATETIRITGDTPKEIRIVLQAFGFPAIANEFVILERVGLCWEDVHVDNPRTFEAADELLDKLRLAKPEADYRLFAEIDG